MGGTHPIKELVMLQKKGVPKGIYSACSANEYVIEACMERALKDDEYVLIEATANQVNQYGGYTGMNPLDFRDFVYKLADRLKFPREKVILGGDHLGPLAWKDENSDVAMKKSAVLIRDYVMAGFTKIHIDTSMHLADDNSDKILDINIISGRGAALCKVAEEAFSELKKTYPKVTHPVYVVGSEVPIPGGSQDEEEGLHVTRVEDFEATVEAFKKAFLDLELQEAWENVIAVVVQPGVEFGDEAIHEYSREAARELCNALMKYPNLVFEGHSTDYQTAEALKNMVEDGIAILKVGPALTFAMREALFALNHMENEIFRFSAETQLSNFIEILESTMLRNLDNWKKHYHGSPAKVRYSMKYSFSDRARYYMPVADVKESIERLMSNLKSVEIPLTLIDQFMPVQYIKIRKGQLRNDPEALLKDRIVNYIDDYMYAVNPKY